MRRALRERLPFSAMLRSIGQAQGALSLLKATIAFKTLR